MRRKEVPDQNASIAVPLMAWEMMGRATLSMVASRAAVRVMVDSVMKAR